MPRTTRQPMTGIKEDGHKCMCPGCRMFRKEITKEAYAWYLKGCIETAETYSRLINTNGDIVKVKKWAMDDRYDIDCAYAELENMLKEGSVHDDIALRQPAVFIPV